MGKLSLLLLGASLVVGAKSTQVGQYLPNWFVYKKHYMGVDKMDNEQEEVGDPTDAGTLFFATDMRASAPYLTHIYYAFYNVNAQCRVADADPDASWYGKSDESAPSWITTPDGYCKGLLNQLLSLKTEFPHLKILISLGGWTYSQNYWHCAKDEALRKQLYTSFSFYASAMDPNWGKSNGLLAGIDFDWEHPATPNGLVPTACDDDDWNNYASLVKEFRQLAVADGRDAIVMTSALGVGNTLTRLTTEFRDAAKIYCDNLDSVNMMTYDFHGKWDPKTGHNAPFCPDPDNADAMPDPSSGWSVVETSAKLADICGYGKLSLGLPNYAPAWTGIPDNGKNGLYQTSTQTDVWDKWATYSDKDTTLVSQGQIHFWDMKDVLDNKKGGFEQFTAYTCQDEGVNVPVHYVYSKEKQAFASFESLEVIKAKVQWAKKKGFQGFFFWDASQDRNGDTLNAAVQAWGGLSAVGASGTAQCYDSNRPNFDVDPLTGKPIYEGCKAEGETVDVPAGSGCSAVGAAAKEKCPSGTAYALGAQHSGDTSCVNVCAYDWSVGPDALQSGDKVFYTCDLCDVNADLCAAGDAGEGHCTDIGENKTSSTSGGDKSGNGGDKSGNGGKKGNKGDARSQGVILASALVIFFGLIWLH